MRVESKFEELMKTWDPTCHSPKFKRLPYFKGIVGRESIAGFTYIDSENYELFSKVMWTKSQEGYVAFQYSIRNRERLGIKFYIDPKQKVHIHKQVLNNPKMVDHIYGLRLDNRRGRLRIATPSKNSVNSAPTAANGFKSIIKRKDKYYVLIRKPKTNRNKFILISDDIISCSYLSDMYRITKHKKWTKLNHNPRKYLVNPCHQVKECFEKIKHELGIEAETIQKLLKDHPEFERWNNRRNLPR